MNSVRVKALLARNILGGCDLDFAGPTRLNHNKNRMLNQKLIVCVKLTKLTH